MLMVGREQPTLQAFCWAMVVVVVMICVNNFAHDSSLLTVRYINDVLRLGHIAYVVAKGIALIVHD